jgi:hypothetical protein
MVPRAHIGSKCQSGSGYLSCVSKTAPNSCRTGTPSRPSRRRGRPPPLPPRPSRFSGGAAGPVCWPRLRCAVLCLRVPVARRFWGRSRVVAPLSPLTEAEKARGGAHAGTKPPRGGPGAGRGGGSTGTRRTRPGPAGGLWWWGTRRGPRSMGVPVRHTMGIPILRLSGWGHGSRGHDLPGLWETFAA